MPIAEDAAQRLQCSTPRVTILGSGTSATAHLDPKIVETQARRTFMSSTKRWSQVLAGGFASLFATGIALAESTGTSVTVTQGGTTQGGTTQVWYGQWWIWAVGIGIFLVVVIALTGRGRARA